MSANRNVWPCSPRRRGWSRASLMVERRDDVLPAQAGVVPSRRTCVAPSPCAPRAGGGGPRAPPRTGRRPRVLPAQAGVVPPRTGARQGRARAPRAGGGGPVTALPPAEIPACSPRRRGWSQRSSVPCTQCGVLPAQAGVVPRGGATAEARRRAPRAGGGGPYLVKALWRVAVCSPRRRGWSTSPPRGPRRRSCAPRAGGGGPPSRSVEPASRTCSPRRRGWSRQALGARPRAGVLPAQAGVVPGARPAARWSSRAPRAGGGGPVSSFRSAAVAGCSPRRRGWSQADLSDYPFERVLPAQAGVVPASSLRCCRRGSAPRAGGGGPRAT